jgi:hypothetical protein
LSRQVTSCSTLISLTYSCIQAILSQFSKSNKASKDANEEGADHERLHDLEDSTGLGDEEVEDVDVVDSDETDPSVEQSDKRAVDSVIAEVELDGRLAPLTREDVNLGRFSILKVCDMLLRVTVFTHNNKLRTLAKKIVHSPTIRADLEKCCNRSQVPPALMIRDVATRWNSTTELIARALKLREPLKLLVIMQEYNKPRGVRLQRYQLSDSEWTLFKQLFSLLDVSIHYIIVAY